MTLKVYISQANQAHNAGPGGYTEKAGMDAISKLLAGLLKADGRFLVKRNVAGDRVDTAAENADEANRWGADRYYALHSNAGGIGARGTFAFYHSASAKGKAMALAVFKALAPLSPGTEVGTRVIAKDGFIEVHRPHAPAVLVEIEAHDWKTGVEFLTGKRKQIARALYEAVCAAESLKPRPAPVALTGKVLKVPVPVKKPKWWAKLTAYLKNVS